MPSTSANRRPIKSRDHRLAQRTAAWLNQRGITPNQISLASIGFAAVAALMLVAWRHAADGIQWILPLLAILGIQGRLLCNLFDGMVAVEGGRSTPAGELYNDMPDRAADALLLVAAGYAAGAFWSLAPWMGWLAALLAVVTAYVRVLGASMGAPMRFSGPMAKQHRMALLSAACLLSVFEPAFWPKGCVLLLAVTVIALGSALTVARRTRDIHAYCEDHAADRSKDAGDV
ncbi:CDP-alcohol phosphatidyltransferase family protein [Salinicola aestuarinus]|uniref:CDP-alcohol phosphatidyltransferase family protein n=1 Tax=Salinicola aestuarinus TaxID=1949082 RepID=UPI000DA173CC|nr:CDP-alcohol phosphatidyltransferase family protein [Salinicola aestuarinus]